MSPSRKSTGVSSSRHALWLTSIAMLMLCPASLVADVGMVGTWEGSWSSDTAGGRAYDWVFGSFGEVTGKWEEPLEPWGLSGTATVIVGGTYDYESSSGAVTMAVSGWIEVQGYDVFITRTMDGSVDGDEASGTSSGTTMVYELDSLVDYDESTGDTWSLTRTSSPEVDEYEPDDSRAEATPIVPGQAQTHSIAPAGDYDWYKLVLTETSQVAIATSGPEESDTYLWLTDANAEDIEVNDDREEDFYSFIDRTCGEDPLPAGTYYIVVAAYDEEEIIQEYSLLVDVAACEDICVYALAGDLDNDCKVTLADLAILAANWCKDCSLNPADPACVPIVE